MIVGRNDIIQVVREVVRLWPYSECHQMNTFAIVDDATHLETDNLGKTYEDYLNGHFWAREWINKGANPDTLKKEYPLLVLEQKEVVKQDMFDRETCWNWWFVFSDLPDCQDCGDCKRSVDTIDTDLQIAALDFMEYLKEIQFIEFDGAVYKWTTQGQADRYVTDGLYSSYRILCGDITSYINTTPLRITPASVGLSEGARSVIFSLTICSCHPQPDGLEPVSEPDTLASAKCKTC